MFRLSMEPWTEGRLAELAPYEYDFQEFKGSAWLVESGTISGHFHLALSKQVSAFANGGGGRIFLGIDDFGEIDGGIPISLKPGGTRSWLEDVITDIVTPRIPKFNVFEVVTDPNGPGRILPDHAVYVIEIPESPDAPHQALDLRYYLRIAGKSRPMGHVHVLDILRRARDPEVAVSRVGPYGRPELDISDPRGPRVHVLFRFFLANRGRTLARHVGTEVHLPRPLVGAEIRMKNLEDGDLQLTQRPGSITLFRYHPTPIFPQQEIFGLMCWVGIHAANRALVRTGSASLAWRVYADDAPYREGQELLWRYSVVREAVAMLDHALREQGRAEP